MVAAQSAHPPPIASYQECTGVDTCRNHAAVGVTKDGMISNIEGMCNTLQVHVMPHTLQCASVYAKLVVVSDTGAVILSWSAESVALLYLV